MIVTNLCLPSWCVGLLLVLAWTENTIGQSNESIHVKNSFRVVGYLPDYRMPQFEPAIAANLTDLILFSAEVTPKGALDMSRLKDVPWPRLAKMKEQYRVRLTLCVGGWERSEGFAVIASDALLRRAFVADCVAICQSRNLDGIDIDWEHPKDEQEQTGYGVLLSELRRALHAHGLQLSMTMAAWQAVPSLAFESVDWIQVMAYDHPGKHSTLDGAKADIERLRKGGAPAAKLTLGIPFYGRDVNNNARTKTYRDIEAEYRLDASADEADGYYFNGPATVASKTGYAMDSGLAGVMVWEIGQDAVGDRALLRVIAKSIRSHSATP